MRGGERLREERRRETRDERGKMRRGRRSRWRGGWWGEGAERQLCKAPSGTLPAPSGANEKSIPRAVPMQHLAPRWNPERSNGH